MDPRESARLGKAALDIGARGRGKESERDDAIDTVANILHYLESRGEEDPAALLSSAATAYFAEREGEHEPRHQFLAWLRWPSSR